MYRTLLLAYEGTLDGRRALREGALVARMSGARVVLLAVVEFDPALVGFSGGVYIPSSDGTAEAREILAEGSERLTRLGLAHEVRLERGAPVERITEVAKEVGADLVVVGHHRQGAVSRWLLGSVTSALSDTLECSLLVARREVSDIELYGPPAGKAVG